jgi:hypothetical protein
MSHEEALQEAAWVGTLAVLYSLPFMATSFFLSRLIVPPWRGRLRSVGAWALGCVGSIILAGVIAMVIGPLGAIGDGDLFLQGAMAGSALGPLTALRWGRQAAREPIMERWSLATQAGEKSNSPLTPAGMNAGQRVVLMVSGALILGTLAFPPYHREFAQATINMGYAPIFAPPANGAATVNAAMLAVQWLGIVILGCIAWLLLRDMPPRRGDASGTTSSPPSAP